MASALKSIGWNVGLIYKNITPFSPVGYFDFIYSIESAAEAHEIAKCISPSLIHVFSGAIDEYVLMFCQKKIAPVVIDLNDVFAPSLFDYCHERFHLTKKALGLADGFCARDLQVKSAERIDGFQLPKQMILYPEYCWGDSAIPTKKLNDEVHVVSIGTISLESQGAYDSCYFQLVKRFLEQKIHFHLYPHWSYRKGYTGCPHADFEKDFVQFIELAERNTYLHIHDSLSTEDLAKELPQYDFGIVSGGCPEFGQILKYYKPEYLRTCYSGRISDYLDAHLPVLINDEVVFDFWLLKKYGVGLDLKEITQPAFKSKLMKYKHDKSNWHAMTLAVGKMSNKNNAARLTKFYHKVLISSPSYRAATKIVVAKNRFLSLRYKQNMKKCISKFILNLFPFEKLDKLYSRLSVVSGRGRVSINKSNTLSLNIDNYNGKMTIIDIANALNWPELLNQTERDNGFAELVRMVSIFVKSDSAVSNPSDCWALLATKNYDQLLSYGYNNFKRTIANNYFNFLVQNGDIQIHTVESLHSNEIVESCKAKAKLMPNDPFFNVDDQFSYYYFVLLLWEYVKKIDIHHYADKLEEPKEGNPVLVRANGKAVSQDLANSLIEYYAISEMVSFKKIHNVLEIGGGYGRDAFVMLTLNPHIKVTLIDIIPALYIAQRYLSSVFKDRKIFFARQFANYEEVKDEMEAASIVFLMPDQLALMPDKKYDLCVNISSFGEMSKSQLDWYFIQINRVTSQYFYMKQWNNSKNPYDGIELKEEDYPIPAEWIKKYSRICTIQTEFFETVYQMNSY